jgi:hypothetical protein
MIDEEIYVLTRHGRFEASYVENIPIYRRRHFLFLLEKEADAIAEHRSKMG